jgi:hypothetical protein
LPSPAALLAFTSRSPCRHQPLSLQTAPAVRSLPHMQTLEKSKATQTTTSNRFCSSKSVKRTAELFEFQKESVLPQKISRMRTQQKSQEKLNQTSNQYRMRDVLKMDRRTLQISKSHFFSSYKNAETNPSPYFKIKNAAAHVTNNLDGKQSLQNQN